MSDRQKGLIGAVKYLFSEAEHRNCVRHMYQNFRQKYKGKALKDLVWNAARASNEVRFRICMERLEQEDREARKWSDHSERPFQTWTRALFKTHSRCDMLLNNLCESFNRYILDARDKAIITLLEMIKNKLMKRLYKKKEWINKYQGLICPKIEKKLNQIRLDAALFRPNFSGGPKVSVEGPEGPFIVDMQKGSCTCRRWDLTGLPCPHALVSIYGNGDRVEDYVNVYYKVETFKNVYSHFINPTNPEDHWPKVMNGGEVLPPKIVRKKKGRKPKLRRKEAEELQKQKQAEAQRQSENGHNARGHYKYVNIVMPETRQPFETQDLVSEYVSWGYSNQFNHDTWDNSQLEVLIVCEELGVLKMKLLIVCDKLGVLKMKVLTVCEELGVLKMKLLIVCEEIGVLKMKVLIVCEELSVLKMKVLIMCEEINVLKMKVRMQAYKKKAEFTRKMS
ncbi:hypothetical protein KY289_036689 [Solanum tuberosum]|nr:hypothetical protein KY289_036689 [Solanum tuberosum]